MSNNKQSRRVITGSIGLLLALAMVYAFWPKPLLVDIAEVYEGEMTQTVNEEAKTAVRDLYTVTMPITGRLARVEVEPGVEVVAGTTQLAKVFATNPALLDARQTAQLQASIRAQSLLVETAKSQVKQAEANATLASKNVARLKQQSKEKLVSEQALEQAENDLLQTEADQQVATFNLSRQQALLDELEASRDKYQPVNSASAARFEKSADAFSAYTVMAPISGTVLQVLNESESVLAAGTPIMTLGDLNSDLEIVTELLSSQAVKVSKGDRVRVLRWGKEQEVWGRVDRIEPFGFTKFSALGVEEQRVNVFITILLEYQSVFNLGHGYRVEVEIEIWRDPNALLIASGALFRHEGQWSVFVVDAGKLRLQQVDVAQNNGRIAAIASGLRKGQAVVIYPSSDLNDGDRVQSRTN